MKGFKNVRRCGSGFTRTRKSCSVRTTGLSLAASSWSFGYSKTKSPCPIVLFTCMMLWHIRSKSGPELLDVPQHHASEEHDGAGRLRFGVSEAPRTGGERQSRGAHAARFSGARESRAAPPHVLEALHAHADRRVLRFVPQSSPRRSGEPLSLGARLQRVRQLASQWCFRPRRALVLLSREFDDVRGLPHAAGPLGRLREYRWFRAFAPLPRGEYGGAHGKSGSDPVGAQPEILARQAAQRGYFCDFARGE